MLLAAIDPGTNSSALVVFDGERIPVFAYETNEQLVQRLMVLRYNVDHLVIEMIASYGMPVSASVFMTCVWIGRFMQSFGADRCTLLKRLEVKLHLTHDSRAKDSHVRMALLDRFGGKDKAIGRKSSPGPLYGIHGDCLSALAVALTHWDLSPVCI